MPHHPQTSATPHQTQTEICHASSLTDIGHASSHTDRHLSCLITHRHLPCLITQWQTSAMSHHSQTSAMLHHTRTDICHASSPTDIGQASSPTDRRPPCLITHRQTSAMPHHPQTDINHASSLTDTGHASSHTDIRHASSPTDISHASYLKIKALKTYKGDWKKPWPFLPKANTQLYILYCTLFMLSYAHQLCHWFMTIHFCLNTKKSQQAACILGMLIRHRKHSLLNNETENLAPCSSYGAWNFALLTTLMKMKQQQTQHISLICLSRLAIADYSVLLTTSAKPQWLTQNWEILQMQPFFCM